MNANIEKILYLGVGVLLLGIAFVFFFSGYNRCRGYIEKNNAILSEDRIVTVIEGKGNFEIRGTEVIHQVLQAKKLQESNKLLELYSDALIPYQSFAEIWVSGKSADDIKISDIDAASSYGVEFKKDNYGRIIKIQYTLN